MIAIDPIIIVFSFLGSSSALPASSKCDWRPDVQSADWGPQRSDDVRVSGDIRVAHAGMSEQGLLSVAAWLLFLFRTFLISH